MTRHSHDLENGSNGNTLTAALAGTTTAIVTGTGHTQTIATDAFMHGSRSAKFVCPDATAGTNYLSVTTPATDAEAVRYHFRLGNLPTTAATAILWLGGGSPTTAQGWNLELTTTGALIGRDDASGAKWTTAPNPVVNTSPGTLVANTWYRLEVGLTRDPSSGTHHIAIYPGDSTTPVAQFNPGIQTGINTGANAYVQTRFGPKCSTSSAGLTMWIDDWMIDDATSAHIGPVTVQLATPTLTLVGKTDPTTFGGSNGTATVSWPAVPGADHYEAGVAPGDVTTGFTVVDAEATSPYQFTGLTAGQKTLSVKAKGA